MCNIKEKHAIKIAMIANELGRSIKFEISITLFYVPSQKNASVKRGGEDFFDKKLCTSNMITY